MIVVGKAGSVSGVSSGRRISSSTAAADDGIGPNDLKMTVLTNAASDEHGLKGDVSVGSGGGGRGLEDNSKERGDAEGGNGSGGGDHLQKKGDIQESSHASEEEDEFNGEDDFNDFNDFNQRSVLDVG